MVLWVVVLLPMLASSLQAGATKNAMATTMVPVAHWSYGLLERLEAAGHLSSTANGIKPLSRGHITRLATQAQSAKALTAVDRQRLELLLHELGADAPLHYRAPQGEVAADLLARQQSDMRSGRGRTEREYIYRNRLGGELRGSFFDQIGFRVAFEQTREQGSRTYSLREDVFERQLEAVQLKGNLADFHQGSAYVTFGLGSRINVQAGKDHVDWGPAPRDNLGLSANAPAFDMIRMRTRLGIFELVSLHGSLQSCPDRPDSPLCAGSADDNASYIVNGMSRRLDPDRWIAAHRMEAALTPTFDLGLQEVVIYADRGPEPAYLNPFMFFWAAQSYLGDKDNVMMAVDVDWRVRPGLRWWAAYAIDDLKKLKILSNDFANKFSLQSGVLWTDPLGLRDLDVRAEYVRIEPWIYTHKFPVNALRHFDSPLGHSLGPNSDRWHIDVARRWTRDLETNVSFAHSRHGDNVLLQDGSIVNVGGDLHRGWRPGDARDDKDFLDGIVSTHRVLAAMASLHLRPGLSVRMSASLDWGDNVPLPPRDGAATPLSHRSGYGDGRQTQMSFDMRYGVF